MRLFTFKISNLKSFYTPLCNNSRISLRDYLKDDPTSLLRSFAGLSSTYLCSIKIGVPPDGIKPSGGTKGLAAVADVARRVPRGGHLAGRPAEAAHELVRGRLLQVDAGVDLLGAPGGVLVGHGVKLHPLRLGDLPDLLHAGVAEPRGVDLAGAVRPRNEEVGAAHDRRPVEKGLDLTVGEDERGLQLDRRPVTLGALLVPRGNVRLVDDHPKLVLGQAARLVGDEAGVRGQAVPDQRGVPADHLAEGLPELERVRVERLPVVLGRTVRGGLSLAAREVLLGAERSLLGDDGGILGSGHWKTPSPSIGNVFAQKTQMLRLKRYFQSPEPAELPAAEGFRTVHIIPLRLYLSNTRLNQYTNGMPVHPPSNFLSFRFFTTRNETHIAGCLKNLLAWFQRYSSFRSGAG